MNNQNYAYALKMYLKGLVDPLIIPVRHDEYERMQRNLDNLHLQSRESKFFNCSSLQGKLYSINLSYLQCIHYLWDATLYAKDNTHFEGPISVQLIGRQSLISAVSSDPEEVYDFFLALETDGGLAFNGFTDIDGEVLEFQVKDIVYATTPEDIYEEGLKIAIEEEGLLDED